MIFTTGHRDCIAGYSNVKPKNTLGMWTPDECYELYGKYYSGITRGMFTYHSVPQLMEIFGRTRSAVLIRISYLEKALTLLYPSLSEEERFIRFGKNKLRILNTAKEIAFYTMVMNHVRKARQMGWI